MLEKNYTSFLLSLKEISNGDNDFCQWATHLMCKCMRVSAVY